MTDCDGTMATSEMGVTKVYLVRVTECDSCSVPVWSSWEPDSDIVGLDVLCLFMTCSNRGQVTIKCRIAKV